MYERTRRRWCLAGFFVFCVAPTLGVVAFCAGSNLPGRDAAEAARLSRQLGFTVRFESFTRLRPGAVRYSGVEVADPETGETLLRCPAIEAAWQAGQDDRGEPRDVLALSAAKAEIAAEGLARLWRAPHRVLSGEPASATCDVRLLVSELSIDDGGRHELTDVQAGVETLSVGTQAHACFRVAGVAMSEPARLRIARNRQSNPPSTGLELDTRGAALPCSLLALAIDTMDGLGPASSFRGYIWANGLDDEPRGELTGQLYGVDLGRLVSGYLPYRFSGTGDLVIHSARFRGRRLDQAVFALSAGPGVFSRALFDTAVERLKLPRCAEPVHTGDLVAYQQLAFAAAIDHDGMRVYGRCDVSPPGTILADARGQLLAEPMIQPQPLAALIQTLAPGVETTLPMTHEADWLARRLPAPRPAAPAAAPTLAAPPLQFNRK